MVEEEHEIDGFFDGSEATKVLYICFIVFGALLLILAYPSTFYNERKYLNLNMIQAVIEERLYRADENKNKTDLKNENKLVFARGPLSFDEPAKDPDLQFATSDGMVLFRNVEIYQWIRMRVWDANTNMHKIEYRRIWSQKIINSDDYDEEHRNNNCQMPFHSAEFYGKVKLGDFTLPHG